MDLRKEKPSKNVTGVVYPNRANKGSRRGATESTGILKSDRLYNSSELKSGREDKIFHSPEFKKALNDIAVEYNKKIGSGKGDREK